MTTPRIVHALNTAPVRTLTRSFTSLFSLLQSDLQLVMHIIVLLFVAALDPVVTWHVHSCCQCEAEESFSAVCRGFTYGWDVYW